MATRSRTSSIELLHHAFDARIDCRYTLLSVQVSEFLRLVRDAYETQGSIEGQRDVVRTATANRIRKRMADDLKKGAILPPIVLGAIADAAVIAREKWTTDVIRATVQSIGGRNLSIIDGMQRTNVLLENREHLPKDSSVRVELWLAPRTENLVYRMLILNTGQIPWNLRRQLEVVYKSLIDEISKRLPRLNIYRADDNKRRTNAGEYQGNDVLEMYLAFNLRKPHVDKESVLADEFSRLDLIEALSKPQGFDAFIEAMTTLVSLDTQFSRAKEARADESGATKDPKFRSGRHIFDKVSACAGFMAAYSQFVFGRIGLDRESTAQATHAKTLEKNCQALVKKLEKATPPEVATFLALDTLRQVSDKRGGALSIGEQERELFVAAFKLLFEEGQNLESMEPCWRNQ